jgi:hypothetical protein
MIDSVRTTVLAIANKNNFGYISPNDFNLYAKQAQIDLFEDCFYQYNAQIRKENVRQSGTGYADITKGIEEVIDSFSSVVTLSQASANTYTLPDDYYLMNRIMYGTAEVERVSQAKIIMLTNSMLTAPTSTYPAYVLSGNTITVYPTTIQGATDISAQYIRYPEDPKWTYVEINDGEPAFDGTASDYKDFELPQSYEPSLVIKILQYAGVSIREGDVVSFANNEELKEQQQEQ